MNTHIIEHIASRENGLRSKVVVCVASDLSTDLSLFCGLFGMSQQSPFHSADINCQECWKHLFLLHLHCVHEPPRLLDCYLSSAVFTSICPSVCVSQLFSGVLERNASSKSWANSEPDVNNWGGQEAREWLLQYSYVILTWLPATRPCTHYLWSLTDDWGCNAVSSPIPFLPLSPFPSHYTFSHLLSICHVLFLHPLPLCAVAPLVPFSFSLPFLLIPFSSAAISLKIMACPRAKFNYRPN